MCSLFKLLGGVFKLELFLPEEYPMAAPKVLHYFFFIHFDSLCYSCTASSAEFFIVENNSCHYFFNLYIV